MFSELAIRGRDGSLLYGYAEAVHLGVWGIQRTRDPKRGPWELSARYTKRNRVYCGLRPLRFTALKLGGGRWCWPVLDLQFPEDGRLIARLGQPEQ